MLSLCYYFSWKCVNKFTGCVRWLNSGGDGQSVKTKDLVVTAPQINVTEHNSGDTGITGLTQETLKLGGSWLQFQTRLD